MIHGKLEKKALLVAINSLAGLSIFFFGKLVYATGVGIGTTDGLKATTRG